MLEIIPIYRMTLKPESYLLMNNREVTISDLICELPNRDSKNRKRELRFLPSEKHKSFYLAHLELETKRFCREMLYHCAIDAAPYETVLQGQDLRELFVLIQQFRVAFFKYLIVQDLTTYKLLKGHMESEIREAGSIEEILRCVKKYGVVPKLFHQLSQEYQKLKSIYY